MTETLATDVVLSPDQKEALSEMEKWWKSTSKTKRPFFLGGPAGTGKSFVTKHFLNMIELSDHTKASPGAVTMAYTGKAAKVMRTNGNKYATTIHKTIYRYIEPSEKEFENLDREIRTCSQRAAKMNGGDDRNILLAHIGSLHKKMNNFFKPTFILDLFGPASTAKLFVLDEVSMVGQDIGSDLLKFGVPILVIGDPFQLPPVDNSAGYFTGRKPDFMLTKIHRQAEGNPIIRLATMAREGKSIPFQTFGEGVVKRPMSDLKAADLLDFDMVLCGKNKTRYARGAELRKLRGIKGSLPTGAPDERLVCKRNNYEIGIVNGERVKLSDVKREGPVSLKATIQSAEALNGDSHPASCSIYTGHFMQHQEEKKDRFWNDRKQNRDMTWVDWADLITVHGAQGGEEENVCVIDDGFRVWGDDAAKMFYTAITRARSKLTIYG